MFTKRQKLLMIELLKKNDYMTSRQLALCVGVSVRTIKSEIKHMNELLEVYDINIEAKTGFGYRIHTMGNKEIPEVNYLLEDMEYDNYLHISNSMESRVLYIACRLLEAADFIKSEVLADELYVSSSTFSHDLKQVKYIFQAYNLKVVSKPYKGLYVSGKEKNIRNCIQFLCFKSNFENNGYYIYGEDVMDRIHTLYQALSNIAEKYHVQYPSYSLYDIAIQTYIAIQRMKQGNTLRDEVYVCSKEARDISQEFLSVLQDVYSIALPQTEICRLQCMMDTLYVVDHSLHNDLENKRLLDEAFQEICLLYDFDFKQGFSLTGSLLSHLAQLIKRCRNDVMIYNPLAKQILCDYLLSVDFANVLARKLEEKYHFRISIDEFSYLVLYFNVTVFSSSRMKEKALYIYSPNSRAEESMIREEVKNLFNEIVNRITVVTREELEHMHYSLLDIIITNVELPKAVPAYIPFIHVDLNNKTEFISNILIQLNKQIEDNYNINEILCENLFYTEENISSKDEYFEFLFDSLCESMIMDYGEASYLYEHVERFGQEISEHVVLVRSQNRFVMPFMHVTYVKDMFYWDTGYVKLILFVNFGDSGVGFRNFIYHRCKALFADKERRERIFKNPDYATFAENL